MVHLLVDVRPDLLQTQLCILAAQEVRHIGHIEDVHADEHLQRRRLEQAEQQRALANRQLLCE